MAGQRIVAGFEGTTVPPVIAAGSRPDLSGSDPLRRQPRPGRADSASDQGASADPAARRPAPLPADDHGRPGRRARQTAARGPECLGRADGQAGPAFSRRQELLPNLNLKTSASTSTSLRCWTWPVPGVIADTDRGFGSTVKKVKATAIPSPGLFGRPGRRHRQAFPGSGGPPEHRLRGPEDPALGRRFAGWTWPLTSRSSPPGAS